MTWQDRDYYRQEPSYGHGGPGGVSFGFPKPTPYVKYLLIINIAIFVITSLRPTLKEMFALQSVDTAGDFLGFWRLITYQFLHGDTWHLFFNMLGLYFFGPPIERYWGSKKFLFFYLFCGVVAGIFFWVLSAVFVTPANLIGASGSVLGLLAGCAILFPHMIVLLLLFPVPIRILALLLTGLYVLNIITRQDLSDAAHLGGMVAALFYIKGRPLWNQITAERKRIRKQALLDQEVEDQQVVDHILKKVHDQGIQSLSRQEKRTLQEITRRQQLRDSLRTKKR